MRARKPKPGVSRLGRFARRWRFDRNPLRRATDRVETAVLALLVAAFLIGAPFAALASGAWVHGMARQAQLSQEASRRQVTAVVLAVAAPLLDSQVADQTTSGEALAVIAAASVLTMAGALARWTLNKRRMAAWDADWHATGPHWTTRA